MSEANPYLKELVPHLARQRAYLPKIDDEITIALPGEMTRAKVKSVSVAANAVVVELISVPMAKSHNYTKGNMLCCRREMSKPPLSVEQWVVIPERELDLAAAAVQLQAIDAVEAQPEAAENEEKTSPATDNWSA